MDKCVQKRVNIDKNISIMLCNFTVKTSVKRSIFKVGR